MRKLIDTNYARARKILEDHMDQLHLVANALMEYETLEDKEIAQVIAGKKLHLTEKKKTKNQLVLIEGAADGRDTLAFIEHAADYGD